MVNAGHSLPKYFTMNFDFIYNGVKLHFDSTNHVLVSGNTDKPYAEWYPAYYILGAWEGNSYRTRWVPYEVIQEEIAKRWHEIPERIASRNH